VVYRIHYLHVRSLLRDFVQLSHISCD